MENNELLRYVPKRIVDPIQRRRVMAPEDEFNHIQIAHLRYLCSIAGHVQMGDTGSSDKALLRIGSCGCSCKVGSAPHPLAL